MVTFSVAMARSQPVGMLSTALVRMLKTASRQKRRLRLGSRNGVVLPAWVVDAVCVVPDGAAPSYAQGYSERDNAAYAAWDAVSRDRDAFGEWLDALCADAGVTTGARS